MLKALGISDFGEIGPRGFRRPYVPAPLELFVDDEPLALAQWPNPGQPGEPVGSVLDKGSVTRNGEKPTRGGTFEFKTDRAARWTKATDVWITGLFENGYADNTVKVKSFDLEKKTLTTVQPHMYGFSSGKPWNRWVALNLLEEIDLPGEFMADKKTGKLYFLPPQGKAPAESRLEVTVTQAPLIALEGATNVVFDGVNIECSRGMGVYIERGANNRIQNATLRNLGMVAVCIGKGIIPDPDYRHAFTGTPSSRELGSWHEHIYDNAAINREAGTGHGIVNCHIYNIFVDCKKPIEDLQPFRSPHLGLFKQRMALVNYDQPPWSVRYPEFAGYLEANRPCNNVYEKNLVVESNDPRFVDGAKGNFALKPGADTGFAGFEPPPFEKMGLMANVRPNRTFAAASARL